MLLQETHKPLSLLLPQPQTEERQLITTLLPQAPVVLMSQRQVQRLLLLWVLQMEQRILLLFMLTIR